MKKLKLNLKDVGEILTREQLKQVFGGSGIEIGGCTITCRSPNGIEHQHDVPACRVGCLQGLGYVAVQCVGPARCHY